MARVLAAILCILACLPSRAPAAELIADLQPNLGSGSNLVEAVYLVSLGERAVIVASEPSSGYEVWASDGTSTGTELLRDLCSGPCPSYPFVLGTIGGEAFFLADSEETDNFDRSEIWRTDGTRQGTAPVTREAPDTCADIASATLGNAILFSGYTEELGCELWRTDGTAEGIRLVADLAADLDSNPRLLTAAGGRVFFAAWTPATGNGLWRSDGTAAGTALVRSFPAEVTCIVAAGSRVLFRHGDRTFSELWQSDGTAAGTVRLAAFADPDAFDRFSIDGLAAVALGSRVLFRGPGGGESGQRLWTSSGPGSKAAPLAGCPGGCPQVLGVSPLEPFGGRILFAALGPAGSVELWSTDGTGPGTRKITVVCPADCDLSPRQIVTLPGQAFFLAGSFSSFGLWRTDGTAAGTVRVATLRRDGLGRNLRAAQAGGRLVFAGNDEVLGAELWASDGTAAGTGPLTVFDETETFSSHPDGFAPLGADQVVFRARQEFRTWLWRSGGTAASTVKLTEVSPFDPAGVAAAGLVFFLKEDENGSPQLWRTDGTPAGTLQLSPSGIGQAGEPIAFGAKVVFAVGAVDPSSLWESDGTPAGTRKLFDLAPQVSGVRWLSALGSELYFVADAPGPLQVFRSDGTAAGTRPVTTTADGFSFIPRRPKFVRLGAHVFFAGFGRGRNVLWRTDGTAAGTVPLLDIPSDLGGGSATDLAELQGSLYLIGNAGLWKSDGTAAGSVLLKAFTPTLTGAPSFARLNGHLFFAASDGEHGLELWRTDGTAEGTVQVRDIAPGKGSSHPRDLEAAGGRVFFRAATEEHGYELWESDGTEDGTRLVQDIAPGAHSSVPEEMTASGGKLYFGANELLNGREPWVHPLSGPGCQADAETLCLGGGRFRVEAAWRDFQGNEGRGKAVALTGDTGYFWFFDPANVEVILKVLDGQGLNGHHWVFYGALSTVEYTLTVTDAVTGAARRYVNPPGRLASVGDTRAFGPLGAHGSALTLGPEAVQHELIVRTARATAAKCVPTATRLCLQGGRFAVEARWTDFQGNQGVGKAVPLTGDTGYFWFFGEDNVEVVLKVLDGRPLNGRFWVFYGALSSVEYTLTVTDTETEETRTYRNPPGRLASVADTDAF